MEGMTPLDSRLSRRAIFGQMARTALGVTVLDTLPIGLTPTAATGSGWACSIAGQVVSCSRGDALASGAAYPAITLTVMVAGTAPASVTNTAWVSGGGEPTGNALLTGNNSAADPVAVNAATDLIIAKSHTGNFTVGVNGTYSLTVANQGRLASTGAITVLDTLPVGLSFVSGSGGGFTCSAVGQVVTCTSPGPLAASASGVRNGIARPYPTTRRRRSSANTRSARGVSVDRGTYEARRFEARSERPSCHAASRAR